MLKRWNRFACSVGEGRICLSNTHAVDAAVAADSKLIQQVMLNLIVNGIQAMSDNSDQ
jgi:phosphoglycerate-specific signal transduction histidine kinase